MARAELIKQGKLKEVVKAPPPELPDEAGRIWAAFVDLDDSRGHDLNGNPVAISYMEIVMRGIALGDPLEPWEVRGVKALDRIRRRGEPGGASNG